MAPRRAPDSPSAGIAAPVEPDQFGRAAGEIPVAAEGAHARGFGARDRHILPDPVARIADDDVLARLLAFDWFHHAFDDLRNLEDVRAVLDLVNDRFGAHAEKAADEDFQQPRRAAGLSAEDAGQRLHGVDRGLVVHVKRCRPVAAREGTRNVEQQPRLYALEIRVVVEALVDADSGPALA